MTSSFKSLFGFLFTFVHFLGVYVYQIIFWKHLMVFLKMFILNASFRLILLCSVLAEKKKHPSNYDKFRSQNHYYHSYYFSEALRFWIQEWKKVLRVFDYFVLSFLSLKSYVFYCDFETSAECTNFILIKINLKKNHNKKPWRYIHFIT